LVKFLPLWRCGCLLAAIQERRRPHLPALRL